MWRSVVGILQVTLGQADAARTVTLAGGFGARARQQECRTSTTSSLEARTEGRAPPKEDISDRFHVSEELIGALGFGSSNQSPQAGKQQAAVCCGSVCRDRKRCWRVGIMNGFRSQLMPGIMPGLPMREPVVEDESVASLRGWAIIIHVGEHVVYAIMVGSHAWNKTAVYRLPRNRLAQK